MKKHTHTHKHFFVLHGLLVLILSSSCKPDFLYHKQVPAAAYHLEIHRGPEVKQGKVDILWVIDNSPSMGTYHDKVKENAKDFMENLSDNFEVDWKMGLLSTDVYEGNSRAQRVSSTIWQGRSTRRKGAPYLGFEAPFDFTHPTPNVRFEEAILLLGLSGHATERSFFPILDTLKRYPHFLRDDALFIIFIVTDAPEQSEGPNYGVTPEDFIDQVHQLKSSNERVFVYGAFAFEHFGCLSPQERNVPYQGSRFQKVIAASGGSAFSACADDFGEKFVQIAEDIKEKAIFPYVGLENRPVPETLQVSVGDDAIVVKGGFQEQKGPYWLYNVEDNAVEFYEFKEIRDHLDLIRIEYQIEDGYDR